MSEQVPYTRRDLELIRAAGIEGLEPVFTVLEQVLNDTSPVTENR